MKQGVKQWCAWTRRGGRDAEKSSSSRRTHLDVGVHKQILENLSVQRRAAVKGGRLRRLHAHNLALQRRELLAAAQSLLLQVVPVPEVGGVKGRLHAQRLQLRRVLLRQEGDGAVLQLQQGLVLGRRVQRVRLRVIVDDLMKNKDKKDKKDKETSETGVGKGDVWERF